MSHAKNVTEHPDGFLVRVKRKGKTRQKLISGHSERSRRKAELLAATWRAQEPLTRAHRLASEPRSNTGIVGVSERSDPGNRKPYTVCLGKGRSASADTLDEAVAIRRRFEREAAMQGYLGWR